MTRTLVAGIGNIFFGDDGFGVELARRLAAEPVPPGTTVVDYGIRGVHLAFELLGEIDRLVIADCMPRGGAPGTLYVLEPALDEVAAVEGAHGMNLPAVFASVRAMGGRLPPTQIIGCEPAETGPGLGLSPPVAHAIDAALELVREVLARPLATSYIPKEHP